jgi:hypothetical protein
MTTPHVSRRRHAASPASLLALLAAPALLLLLGCAQTRSVYVYAEAQEQATRSAFVTIEADPEWDYGDLTADAAYQDSFGRYRNAVRAMLEDAGFTVLNEPAGADAIVLLGYAVTGAIHRAESPPEPVFAGRENRADPPRRAPGAEGGSFQYSRIARLRAFAPEDVGGVEGAEALWVVEMESVGPFRRLETTFPYLLEGGREWVGRDMDVRTLVGVSSDAPRVRAYEEAMQVVRPVPAP